MSVRASICPGLVICSAEAAARHGVPIALSTDWAQRTGNGYTRSVGDLLENDAEVSVNQPNQVFQRSTYYQATPEVADQALKQRIRAGAGPRTSYCR